MSASSNNYCEKWVSVHIIFAAPHKQLPRAKKHCYQKRHRHQVDSSKFKFHFTCQKMIQLCL